MGCLARMRRRLVGSSDPSLIQVTLYFEKSILKKESQFDIKIESTPFFNAKFPRPLLVNIRVEQHSSRQMFRDKCAPTKRRFSSNYACNLHIYIYIYIYIGDMGVSRIRGREKIYVCPSAGNKSSDRVLNFDSTDQVGSGGERMRWREWWMIVSDKLTESKIDVHTFVPSPPVHVQFYSVKLTT